MTKNLKVYVITLSRVFPVSHPKAGLKTYFKTKLENTNVVPFDPNGDSVPDGQPQLKRHTIRANYELWRKRFEQIERGEAFCQSGNGRANHTHQSKSKSRV